MDSKQCTICFMGSWAVSIAKVMNGEGLSWRLLFAGLAVDGMAKVSGQPHLHKGADEMLEMAQLTATHGNLSTCPFLLCRWRGFPILLGVDVWIRKFSWVPGGWAGLRIRHAALLGTSRNDSCCGGSKNTRMGLYINEFLSRIAHESIAGLASKVETSPIRARDRKTRPITCSQLIR